MKYNRVCMYCGNKYYVCNHCVEINSWKNSCCSRDCYRQLIMGNKLIKDNKIEDGSANMKVVFPDRSIRNVVGYDLQLGRFDLEGGLTITVEDADHFIIDKDEMADIIDFIKENINRG